MEIKDILKIIGDDWVADIKYRLTLWNKVASGKLFDSVKSEVINNQLNILAEDYIRNVSEGRLPGKMPPISAIEDWCRIRGIDQKAAWHIAKKIKEDGIKPTNILQNSLRYMNSKIKSDFTEEFRKYIDLRIDEMVLEINKK